MIQKGCKGLAVLFLSHRRLVVAYGQLHTPVTLHLGRDPLPTVQEDGCAAGLLWMGADNLTLTHSVL